MSKHGPFSQEFNNKILDYLRSKAPEKSCLNCGEKFDPEETGLYYTCSVECGAEAARILNEQRPLFTKQEE